MSKKEEKKAAETENTEVEKEETEQPEESKEEELTKKLAEQTDIQGFLQNMIISASAVPEKRMRGMLMP